MKNKETIDKKQENQEWIELCEYVYDEILQYSSDLKFPKYLVLRLRGLRNGQFLANKKIKPLASYDYKVILYTFKACKYKILQYINKTEFNDEKHKINSIMMFIENEINDIVIRLKNAQKAKEKTVNLPLENQINNNADYKVKSKDVIKELEELW